MHHIEIYSELFIEAKNHRATSRFSTCASREWSESDIKCAIHWFQVIVDSGFGCEIGQNFACIMCLIAVVVLLHPAQVSCGCIVDGTKQW